MYITKIELKYKNMFNLKISSNKRSKVNYIKLKYILLSHNLSRGLVHC